MRLNVFWLPVFGWLVGCATQATGEQVDTNLLPPLRCRLIDSVDCTQPDTHDFVDDGGSRVLDLPGGQFRVTAVPKGFELKWFSYTIRTANKAGVPHLLVLESPNDRERYTTATLTVPRNAPWSPPYRGAEKVKLDGYPLYQSPIWYEPDVGLSVYTGRELPVDDTPFRWQLLFYPKSAEMTLTISSSGWDLSPNEVSGGAVSRVWVYEVLDDLAKHRPSITPPEHGAERRIGLYVTHPWYFLAHYGVPPHTLAQRRQSLENMCDLLAFCGMNLLHYNAINGADRASRAWYPGSEYPQIGVNVYTGKTPPPVEERPVNLLDELPAIAAERGIDLVPAVTSLTLRGEIKGETPNEFGFSTLSYQHPADPKKQPKVFGHFMPDPLRPETQDWLVKHVVEIAEGSRAHRNVIGIGFRVNGKIGTCYVAGEDKTTDQTIVVPASEVGYSKWNLDEFRQASGLPVPEGSMAAYEWLREAPARWDAWLDFRCERTRDCWLRARDEIRRIRPDWKLYVLTDLPAELPGTNIHGPGHDALDAAERSLELLRTHGLDPRLFKNEEGIVIQRAMMVDSDRFFSKWGGVWGQNAARYRDFHEQAALSEWYKTAGGSAVEVYHTYWEEAFHPQGEFGPDGNGVGLRTATPMAVGRAFYRPVTFALRTGNVDSMVLTGWHRPVMGHEHDIRRMAQAIRALPAVEPRHLLAEPVDERIVAGQYGDRIGVINATPEPVRVKVRLAAALKPGTRLVDVDGHRVAIDRDDAERAIFTVDLDAYDIRAFRVE